MNVACTPVGTSLPKGTNIKFRLFDQSADSSVGSVGTSLPEKVRRRRLNPSARAWDFLAVALSVIGADESCVRSKSPDGWTREINLTVAVQDVDFWNTQTAALERALAFLTTDLWRLTFIPWRKSPDFAHPSDIHNEDCVCLLSGGLDSLIGALDLSAAGKRAIFVSQVADGDKRHQKLFAQTVASQSLHLQLNHNARPPRTSERSQRARSVIFIGFGVLAASCLARHTAGEEVELVVPENGFISLNVPLTPMRLGSHSTRTTHPYFISQIQQILTDSGFHIRIRNPYQFKTKGEMLLECKQQAELEKLAGMSTSCGRFARFGFEHCGRCVPCLIRRAAFLKWGKPDTTAGYKFENLGLPGAQYRDYDDVRSAAMAIKAVEAKGLDYWIGGALNSAQIGPPAQYRSVVSRGLDELRCFLIESGAL